MPNTYTQLLVQIVFATQGRQQFIPEENRELIHRYITSVVQDDGHRMLAVFCMPDHIHLLLGLNPATAISDLVLDIKRASTNFINERGLANGKFQWQKGYGAFSYGQSQMSRVVQYIRNQEEHHRKKSFREEYFAFLDRFQVSYREEYLFEFYDGPPNES